MNQLTFVIILLLSVYTLALLPLAIAFAVKSRKASKAQSIPVTVIVCARNEGDNIRQCLESILSQQYPKQLLTVKIVDDHSSDNTAAIASEILSQSGIRHDIIRHSSHLGKKRGLQTAIMQSDGLVVTRDADTIAKSDLWLQALVNAHINKKADFIIMPVHMMPDSGLLWGLQAVEQRIMSMMAIGAAKLGTPFICSGANLAYTTAAFRRVNGYTSHIHIPSGDDVLLLEDIRRTPGLKIYALDDDDAVGLTKHLPNLRAVHHQKIRWAGKLSANPNWMNMFIAVMVAATTAVWLLGLIAVFCVKEPAVMITCLVMKVAVDYLLLILAIRGINKKLLKYGLPVLLIYPFYAIWTSIGVFTVKPEWKK